MMKRPAPSHLSRVACCLIWICWTASTLLAQGESYVDVFLSEPAAAVAADRATPGREASADLDDVTTGAFGDLLRELGQCRALEELAVADMTRPPLFERQGDACRPSTGSDGPLFADAGCEEPFIHTSFARFCRDHLLGNDRSKEQIGHPPAWRGTTLVDGRAETPWTLSPGHRLEVNVLDQTRDNRQPFRKQVEYRRVGDCALGMHVYSRDPGARDLEPLMLLHGGGWRLRGAAAIAGIESIAPHLTERGYVVFAPFHRLVGDVDGPASCRNATGRDLIDDVIAARDWIFDHGSRYGMDPSFAGSRRMSVIGQSSGAHLAAYLYTHQPQTVERALLLYPPTDFTFVLENIRPGGLYENGFLDGRERLRSFLSEPGLDAADALDPGSPLAAENSFPALVQADPESFPPLFLIHGTADSQVPVESSSRLCQALDPADEPAAGRYRGERSRSCGPRGSLRLIDGADHVCDLRCATGDLDLLARLLLDTSFCPPGSDEGAAAVRDALREAYALF